MRNFIAATILMITCATDVAGAGRFSPMGLNNDGEMESFLKNLQSAVGNRDSRAVSEMVVMPITISNDSAREVIKTPHELKNKFDAVFDPDLSLVIQCQEYKELGVNKLAAAIGNGIVYIALAYQGERKNLDPARDSRDYSDRRFWRLKVVGINKGDALRKQANKYRNNGCSGHK